MRKAKRIEQLGSETAFLVGAEAAALERKGQKTYPFHLGDMNISTPPNIIEAAKKALDDGKTGYCPNSGIMELREQLAQEVASQRGLSLDAENVVIQPGGKPVIGKTIQVLMESGDEVLYPNPGYPIYEFQIQYFGGKAVPYRYVETDKGFQLDIQEIEKKITGRTSGLIFNNYHNPTGASASEVELKALAKLCVEYDLWVLSDEAYFDMLYDKPGRSIVSQPGMLERSVILYTFSKKFAMTGWRLGAAIGPKDIVSEISRINTNDESCSNHFVQWAAVEALRGDQSHSKKIIDKLKKRRDAAVHKLNSMSGIKTACPESTFYLFPNVTGAMKLLGLTEVESFRKLILNETGVSFCSRNHFGKPQDSEDQFYIRLAYSGIDISEINEGLEKMKAYIINHSR